MTERVDKIIKYLQDAISLKEEGFVAKFILAHMKISIEKKNDELNSEINKLRKKQQNSSPGGNQVN